MRWCKITMAKRELKIDSFKKEFLLLDEFYPKIELNLPRNENVLIRHIAKFRDKNAKILSSPYPTDYPIFKKEDAAIIFESCGFTEKELNDIRVEKTKARIDLA
jgi:hypothetical protein